MHRMGESIAFIAINGEGVPSQAVRVGCCSCAKSNNYILEEVVRENFGSMFMVILLLCQSCEVRWMAKSGNV